MSINWFKKKIKPKNLPVKNHEEKELFDFLDFLWKQISTPSNADHLKSKIKLFNKLSLTKKIEALPEIYLLFEECITEKKSLQKKTKQLLRDDVISKHNALLNYPDFALIFQPLREQELTLCRVFLLKVLEKSSELLGNYVDPKITIIKDKISKPYDFQQANLIKERKNLLEYSTIIFGRIKDSLGINAITNIYLLIYKKHFQSYGLLDSFTAILNVIPEEILAKDLINFPSKQQMLKMLQTQLYSLEEINEKLTQEIVEKKKIEDELKHSEHLKTTILETAMDGVILVNSKGQILNWNKQAEHILEVSKTETIGQSIYSLVPYKLREQLKKSFKNYIITGDDDFINRRVETSVKRKDGSLVYVELTIVAIKTKYDYLFNAFFRDITDRKIIDNEIREAKVLAEKSTKAKSVFLSNMSHEIRTPLNVILGLTGILQKSDFQNLEIDRKNLDGIKFSAENLLDLINDVLDFSKIEAGKLTLQKTDFNLLELMQNVSRGFKIKAEEKGLNYKMNIDKSLPNFVIGDQLRLNQILTNLLGNAIKFTSKGDITLIVNQEITDNRNIKINFAVKDSGIGIPKDKLNYIFESFYQVHKPGKSKIEGTGLGLSISKQLIELQGGKLLAKSTPNIGSTFSFSIEYEPSTLKFADPSKDKTSSIENHHLSGMNVLIVEDNKMNQFFIKQLFSNWNIKADIADHGKMALEMLEDKLYDLILMDMHMPVMDGEEATKIIRASKKPTLQQIPIIACSADVFPESKKKAIEAGMNFYITKPISEKSLEEILYSLKSNSVYANNKTTATTPISDQKTKTRYCDLSFLRDTFGNDTEIIKSVIQIFIEETPQDYEKLLLSISNKDLYSTEKTAHKLKSSFKTLGLSEQTALLQQIEQSAKNQESIEKIQKLFAALNDTYPFIIEEIKNEDLLLNK